MSHTDPSPDPQSAAAAPQPAGSHVPPPPDIPQPPPPSAVVPGDPPISKPDVPSPEEARRAKVKLTDSEKAELAAKAHGAPAPFGTRFLAALIDAFVAGGLAIIFTRVPWVGGLLSSLAALSYLVTRDSLPFLKGQSIGKKAFGLMVVKGDGKPITEDWKSGLIRNAILLIPCAGPLIEIIVLITRDDKAGRGTRLGDDWAGTRVLIHKPEEQASEPPSEQS